mgnify:CR=1 FL=1
MSSPDREKEKAALSELDKFYSEQNEIAAAIADRHAKIEWIKREIKELGIGQLNRIVHEIKLLKG